MWPFSKHALSAEGGPNNFPGELRIACTPYGAHGIPDVDNIALYEYRFV